MGIRSLDTEGLHTGCVANFDGAVTLLDSDGRITEWSMAAQRLLGYRATEMIGRPLSFLLADGTPVPNPLFSGDAQELLLRHHHSSPVPALVRLTELVDGVDRPHWLLTALPMREVRDHAMERAVLTGLTNQTSIGLAVMDTDLRYAWLNTALERRGGVPARDRLGRHVQDVLPGLVNEELLDRMHKVLQTGIPVTDYEYHGFTPADPEHEIALSTSFFRLEDDHERVLGLGYAVVDVTDRYQARQRLVLLNEAGARFSSTLDTIDIAAELADVAVPQFADLATVDLIDHVATVNGDGTASSPGADPDARTFPVLRRAAVRPHTAAGADPERLGEPFDVVPASPQARALAHLRPELESPRESSAGEAETPGDQGSGSADPAVGSLLTVPLATAGHALGTACFVRSPGREPFEADDVLMAQDMADRAAVCMENAVRFARERAVALTLQRSLLMAEAPEQNAMEVAHRYLPAGDGTQVGGAWYDVIPLSGARSALVVGRATGRGVHAAAGMGRLRTAVRTLAALDLPPGEVLAQLDDLVASLSREASRRSPVPSDATDLSGSTCLYAVYDPVSRRCSLASAGHPAPGCLLPEGTVRYLSPPVNPALGRSDGLPFESAEAPLPDGGLLALFTSASELPPQRFLQVLMASGGSPEAACDALASALAPASPSGDVALLLTRARGLPSGHVTDWEISGDPASVTRVRSEAAAQAAHWGLADDTFVTELLVSELATNAVRYGRPPLSLRLIHSRNLICEVSDASDTSPHVRRAAPDDEGGRGLFLVAQLAERWGTRYTPQGKTVWAEQPFPAG